MLTRPNVGGNVGTTAGLPPAGSAEAAMKRAGKPLDVKDIEALRPRPATYRMSDGGGLLLEVRPSGAKVWLCRLTVGGKRRDMGLGAAPP